LALCVLNVGAAPISKPTIAAHGVFITSVKAQQPTSITITDYPKQVKAGVDFDVKGRLTAGNNGVGNALICYEEYSEEDGMWHCNYNFTTDQDGSFTDTGNYSDPGTYHFRYAFFGDNQYAPCRSDEGVITVVNPQQLTSITITDYPKQVKVGADFEIKGRLAAGNNGIGNVVIHHQFSTQQPDAWTSECDVTTNQDGSFTETFQYTSPGWGHSRFTYDGNSQYAPCMSDVLVITASRAPNGQLKWSYATEGAVWSSPAVSNGIVYIGSSDHNVYALNATTGAKIWNYTTGDQVGASPAIANGVVYIGSWSNNVSALDARTGVMMWSYTTETRPLTNLRSPTESST